MMAAATFFALDLGIGSHDSYAAQKKVRKSSKSAKPRYSRSYLKIVQSFLAKKGYRPGKIDGFWGRQTSDALKKFQKDNNLKVTGIVDKNTEKLLFTGKR